MAKASRFSVSWLASNRMLLLLAMVAVVLFGAAAAQAASGEHAQLMKLVDQNAAHWQQVSKQIWDYAELGYHETKSSELLQEQLKAAGFRVQAGVADEPTAFIASYGEGKPVVAILGEFDALPGLSQQPVPTSATRSKPARRDTDAGTTCSGSGAALAAVSLKQYMESNHVAGTLRYYGTPAEEGGSGKVYMVREGVFKDVDVVLHWHPGDNNAVSQRRPAGGSFGQVHVSRRGRPRGDVAGPGPLGAGRRDADGQRALSSCVNTCPATRAFTTSFRRVASRRISFPTSHRWT